MKAALIILAATLAGTMADGKTATIKKPPKPFDFAGRWETNIAALNLRQKGDHATGDYAQNDGKVFLTVKGSIANGWWTQSTSGQRCPQIKLGSHFYGRMQLIAQADGKSFNGEWAYCEAKLGAGGGSWTGKRK